MISNPSRRPQTVDRVDDLILSGRSVNVAHVLLPFACLLQFLVVVVIAYDLMLAMFACWPDLHTSSAELLEWTQYAGSHHGAWPQAADDRLKEIVRHQDAIARHFATVRDGRALVMTALTCTFVSVLFVVIVWLRAYIYEGLQARRLNRNATMAHDRLLALVADTLPSDFPQVQLRLARATFIRNRLGGGVTAFLQNKLVALLPKNPEEFRFVLSHELFHLRCHDNRAAPLAKALLRLATIPVAIAVAVLAITTEKTILPHPLLALLLAPATAVLAIIYVCRADAPFYRHKELLADRYAALRHPSADLDLVYSDQRTLPTHPTRQLRLAFLRDGSTDTAIRAFLALQEVAAVCICAIVPPFGRDLLGPILWTFRRPAAVLAFVALLILALHTTRFRVPLAMRRTLRMRTATALICCLAIASWRPSFFIGGQILLLLLVTAARRYHEGQEETVVNDAPSHGDTTLNLLGMSGTAASAIGLVFSVGAIFYLIWSWSLLTTFRNDLTYLPTMKPPWMMLQIVVVLLACVQNLRRPTTFCLLLESVLYLALWYILAITALWTVDIGLFHIAPTPPIAAVRMFLNPEALAHMSPFDHPLGVSAPRALGAAALPCMLTLAFYVRRIRAALTNRREASR